MSNRIVAIRHAQAKSEGYPNDKLHPLSEEGKQVQLKVANRLKEEGIFPDKIWSSPLLRAKQSAEIISEAFSVNVEEKDALGNKFNSKELLQYFTPMPENTTIFLIGHAPSLGEFVNELVGKNILPEGIKKSGVVIIDFDESIQFGLGKFIAYYKP